MATESSTPGQDRTPLGPSSHGRTALPSDLDSPDEFLYSARSATTADSNCENSFVLPAGALMESDSASQEAQRDGGEPAEVVAPQDHVAVGGAA